ncbi:hypothetical protein C8N46_102325 [Kordia periserrulae]|uniref:Uncharacterized protein n=1 Tax=Kordia periserrulae TaxID=701523 RepID=A0A2T6C3P2_9FLAO|nr:hypothetical protein C8N46_102325 [Kordia periserrulae]
MKKRNFTSLALNKRSISTFEVKKLKGGNEPTDQQGWTTCVVTRCNHH